MSIIFRSSPTNPRSKLHNYFLRKRRKWPIKPFKSTWQEDTFGRQQALQTLKQSAQTTPSTHLLSSLIQSFTLYNCDPTPTAYLFLIKILAKTSHFQELNLLLDRLQSVEKFETPEYILTHLIKIYGDANMVQESIDLFFKIPDFRCNPSVESLNTLLSVLRKRKKGLLVVPQILLRCKVMGIRLEKSSFDLLIEALCRFKKANYAVELLKCMVDDGFTLDGKTCSLIVSRSCEQKEVSCDEVVGVFEEMRKIGFCPRMIDWRNVVRLLVKRGKDMDALDVLNQMKIAGVKPDVVCYTMVLDGVVGACNFEKADEVFDEMLVLGLVPDIFTYNVYVNGLCQQNNVDAGIRMLGYMEEMGCKPDLITYHSLLRALSESGELSKAWEVVKRMEVKGVQRNSRTYEIMIGLLVREGEIYEACGLLEEMVDKCFIHRSPAFDDILCGLCKRGLLPKALELIREMVGRNVAPGGRAWEALIVGSGFKENFEGTASAGTVRRLQTD
ncbi:hypothetical protein RJ640_010311 [Escallonia rubra]|uniref:Pentatricopeptide repeat-containing protein n=1 Tax=Escallonia rubra TaxID=112253 RepID=A0AA88UEE6_9ASTE|nr:hypothetical protein RJ640_010311 [Escallonia rubra]